MAKIGELAKDPHTGRMRVKVSEDDEQEVVVQWMEIRGLEFYHIPNGAALKSKVAKNGVRFSPEANRMKRLGVRKGISDLLILTVPPRRPTAPGAWLEMKMIDGSAEPEQRHFSERRRAQGWPVCIARGANEAIAFLISLGY